MFLNVQNFFVEKLNNHHILLVNYIYEEINQKEKENKFFKKEKYLRNIITKNEVVGAQIVTVPLSVPLARAQQVCETGLG